MSAFVYPVAGVVRVWIVRTRRPAPRMLPCMKLVPLPGRDGKPTVWVAPAHVTAVIREDMRTGTAIQLRAEVKVEGLSLHRVHLGEHPDQAAADAAWQAFLDTLSGST